jgi:ABC-type nickel/cobalt efflux system permease component RcnA
MGNFSINHFSALEVHQTSIRISYVIDMAEIPAFQEIQEHGLIVQPDHPSVAAYREQKAQELKQGLSLQVGNQVPSLSTRSSAVTFPPGAGGLPTLRITAVYEAPLETASGQIVYEDRNYPQRAGWKEIIATAKDGATLTTSSVPGESQSNQLTTYTADLLRAPPQDLQASLSFTVSTHRQQARSAFPSASLKNAAGAGTPLVEKAKTPRSAFADLITARHLSAKVLLLSLLVALGLGAFHALEPGHGKTLVAAYLVGSRGTAGHALLLGLTVTASHTIGVYALGGVTLFASHYVLPEQLYPWLGFTSGLLIMVMGVVLLTKAWHRHHDHHYHYHHDHHHHSHPHAHHSHNHQEAEQVSYGALLTLGITGGMIPCPAALVVLLSAVALQRIAFGLLLIVVFSVGLAAVLVGTGLLLVSARGFVQRWSGEGPWLAYLPFFSPLVITPLGLVIAVRSLVDAGVVSGLPF